MTLLEKVQQDEITCLKPLFENANCMALSRILNGYTLSDYQCFVIAYSFLRKRMIISLDTGLGKTLVAAAIMQILKNQNKTWLYICQLNSVNQTVKKLSDALPNFNIVCTDCKSDSLRQMFKQNLEKVDVLILTYDAFRNLDMNNWILYNRELFIGIVLDESHNVANKSSQIHDFLKLMMRHSFPYQYCLTATPLRVNPDQFIHQVNLIDPKTVPDPNKLAMMFKVYENNTFVGYKDLTRLEQILSSRYISVTRQEVGAKGKYNPKFIPLKNVHDPDFAMTPESPKIQKADRNGIPIETLIKLVKEKLAKGEKGIIYANLNKYKSAIMSRLSEFCRVREISGRISKTSVRTQIQNEFNNNELDVIVLNVTESLDLTCDFIIFYELTSLYKQVIGRGERGLSGRDLDIYFLVIVKNYELNFFFRNVYQNGLLLEKLAHKDINELHSIHEQIMDYLSDTQKELVEEALSG